MRFYLTLFLLFLCCSLFCSAQGQNVIRVTGLITDTTGAPLPLSTVLIQTNKNNPILAYCTTDNEGKYTLTITTENDSLVITAHSLGYENKLLPITSIEIKRFLPIQKNFILNKTQIALNEVVIKAPTQKISIVKDTITFKADSFRNNTERLTEDLLKKLPGIDVSKNGQITINGKPIKKILIEGDDLFNKNYTLLSRNLSADVIDKIQIIDRYTDNPLLKGIVNSDDKVINVILKKNRKKILFGNANLEAGNDNKYDFSTNLISFYNKTKVFLFDSYNTVGRDPVPEINKDQSIEEESNKHDNDGMRNRLIQPYNFQPQVLDNERVNFNHTKLGSLSFITKPNNNLTIKGLGYALGDNISFSQINSYSYIINTSTINISENNANTQTPLIMNGYLKVIYQPKKNILIDYTFNTRYDNSSENTKIISDTNSFLSQGVNNSLKLNHRISYSNRISDKKVFSIEGEYTTINNTQTAILKQGYIRQLPYAVVSSLDLNQFVSYPLDGKKISSQYILGTSNNNMTIETGVQIKRTQLFSHLDTGTSTNYLSLLSDTFKNNVILKRQRYYVGISTIHEIKNNTKITLGLESDYQITDLKNNQFSKGKNHYFYIMPKIGLQWKKNNNSFSIIYSYNTSFADITSIYNGFILTNYRTIQNGGAYDIPSNTHSGLINYSYADWSSGITLYLNYFYIRDKVGFANQFLLNNYFDVVSKVSSPGNQTTSIYSFGIDKLIPFLSSTLKLRENLNQNSFISHINTITNHNNFINSNTQLSLRSAFKGIVNFQIGTAVNYSSSKNITQQNNSLLENVITSAFVDGYLTFSEKLNAKINYEQYYFNSIKGNKRSYSFLDFSTRYELKKNKISISIDGKNILNNHKFINSSVNNYSKQIEQYNLMSQYVLFGLEYRF